MFVPYGFFIDGLHLRWITWRMFGGATFLFVGIDGRMCDALRDLVRSVQFEKRANHPWRSVTLLTLLHG